MVYMSMSGESPNRELSIFYNDKSNTTVPEDHPRFNEIVQAIISGGTEEKVRSLVDLMEAAGKTLKLLSERVSVVGRVIFFDGDPIYGELADAIRDMLAVGEGEEALRPLVNFLEKVKTNPSQDSVDDLYRWIRNGDLVIHEDGDFLAYKGVGRPDSGHWEVQEGEDGDERVWVEDEVEEGLFLSGNSGEAYVDGEYVKGRIPNRVGSVITMPRSQVDTNRNEYCSVGLHAGTHSFARSYAQAAMLLVKVNPRDVVSVPADSSGQKLRVCRYEVLEITEDRLDTHYYPQPELPSEDDEDDSDGDEWAEGDPYEDEDEDEDLEDDEGVDYSRKFSQLRQQVIVPATMTVDGTLEIDPKLAGMIRAEMSEGLLDGMSINESGDVVLDSDSDVVCGFVPEDPEDGADEDDEPTPKLEALAAKESPFEGEPVVKAIRNDKGQFTKESVQNAVRDALGRFRGLKTD